MRAILLLSGLLLTACHAAAAGKGRAALVVGADGSALNLRDARQMAGDV